MHTFIHILGYWTLISMILLIPLAVLRLRRDYARRWPQVPTSPDLDLSDRHALPNNNPITSGALPLAHPMGEGQGEGDLAPRAPRSALSASGHALAFRCIACSEPIPSSLLCPRCYANLYAVLQNHNQSV